MTVGVSCWGCRGESPMRSKKKCRGMLEGSPG